jgi:hypothetical protein
MAATLTHSGEETYTYASFPIAKMEETADGDLYVYGKATDGIVDSDEQIVDPDWAAKALQDWFTSGANLRVQHNPARDPAGKGVEVYDDGHGGQWVKSLVVEPVAKELVRKGVLQAYSVGIMRPNIVPDRLARNGRINGGELGELSLVDRPANKGCRFELVKSFGGVPEFTGKMYGTETLNKASTSDTMTVEIPKNARIKVSPADLAKMLAKRDFDPSVGGGVDRDKIPDEDFAGPERSFPIVTPKDVEDINPNLNHPNLKGDPAKIKQRAMAIASRKGPAFEAKIPDSWKEGSTDTDDTTKGQDGDELVKGKKPFPGAAKPFKKDGADADAKADRGKWDDDADSDDSDDDDSDSADKTASDEVVKGGGKDCPECGKTYHADSKMKKCENCGAKLPKADVAKGSKNTQMGDADDDADSDSSSDQDDDLDDSDEGSGGNSDASEYDDSDDDSDSGDDDSGGNSGPKGKKSNKSAKVACMKCNKSAKPSSKFCPNCGSSMEIDKKSGKKSGKVIATKAEQKGRTEPTPGDTVTGEHTEPVAPHREPDGAAIEAFEADAKLPTDPDSQFKTLMRTQSLGIPQDMATLHDMLCPAYSAQSVHAAHPDATLKSVDVGYWREAAYSATTGGTYEQMMAMAKMLQHAETITRTDDRILDELRGELRASFKAINPEQTTAIHPGSITPGQFRRPYISSDARASFQQQGPNTGPDGFASVTPNQFERGFLDAGRAAESPISSDGSLAIPKPSGTGSLSPVNYGPAMKDNARQAMVALHDHIAQTFPDLCSMGAPGDTGGTPRNPGISPVGKNAADKTPKTKQAPATKAATAVPTATENGAEILAKAFAPDVFKGAVAEAVAPLLARLTEMEAESKKQRKANKAMAAQLDKMAGMADPRVAPFKGMAQEMANKSYGSPAGGQNPAGIAAQAQLAVQNGLAYQAYNDTDPVQREAALIALMKARGIIQ